MTILMQNKRLIVVVGATAVGKTELGVAIAKQWQSEVISADSRQMYQELAIGTAKPTEEEMGGVPHHFVDDRSVLDPMSAGDFERESVERVIQLFQTHDDLVLVGGSGLYVKALMEGFDDMPDIPAGLRDELNARLESEGLPRLVEELMKLDPEHVAIVDIQNPQRVIRALEVSLGTGKPYSSYRKGRKPSVRPWRTQVIGLTRERSELYQRIDQRMDHMLEMGLEEEALEVMAFRHLPPLQTVGYQEIYGHHDGKYDREEMVRRLKRNTRRFAKRQETWFNRQLSATWYHPNQQSAIMDNLQRE